MIPSDLAKSSRAITLRWHRRKFCTPPHAGLLAYCVLQKLLQHQPVSPVFSRRFCELDRPVRQHGRQNPVHVHDLHATILHLLGLDHERLTYRYSGRDFRLTAGWPSLL